MSPCHLPLSLLESQFHTTPTELFLLKSLMTSFFCQTLRLFLNFHLLDLSVAVLMLLLAVFSILWHCSFLLCKCLMILVLLLSIWVGLSFFFFGLLCQISFLLLVPHCWHSLGLCLSPPTSLSPLLELIIHFYLFVEIQLFVFILTTSRNFSLELQTYVSVCWILN